MGVFVKDGRFYIRYKNVAGKWKSDKTPWSARTGTDEERRSNFRKSQKLHDAVVEKVAKGMSIEAQGGPKRVRQYGEQWLQEREVRGLLVRDHKRHLEQHAYPVDCGDGPLGDMVMEEVRPRHLRKLVQILERKKSRSSRTKGQRLAPRTVRGVYSTLRAMFSDAATDEIIDQTPCILRRHQLPRDLDKDPNWRDKATFDRGEVERLISDVRLPLARRVLWATMALGGPRVGSTVVRQWKDIDLEAKPLGRLSLRTKWQRERGEVEGTKTGVAIYVPIHPTLAALLREWRITGWQEWVGRPPLDDDYVFPTQDGEMRSASNIWLRLQRDLEALDMRRRRVHDLRAAFISIAREDGADAGILKWVSHGPSRRQIVDTYTRLPWEVLCREVAKARIELLKGEVVELRATAGDSLRSLRNGQIGTKSERHSDHSDPPNSLILEGKSEVRRSTETHRGALQNRHSPVRIRSAPPAKPQTLPDDRRDTAATQKVRNGSVTSTRDLAEQILALDEVRSLMVDRIDDGQRARALAAIERLLRGES